MDRSLAPPVAMVGALVGALAIVVVALLALAWFGPHVGPMTPGVPQPSLDGGAAG